MGMVGTSKDVRYTMVYEKVKLSSRQQTWWMGPCPFSCKSEHVLAVQTRTEISANRSVRFRKCAGERITEKSKNSEVSFTEKYLKNVLLIAVNASSLVKHKAIGNKHGLKIRYRGLKQRVGLMKNRPKSMSC